MKAVPNIKAAIRPWGQVAAQADTRALAPRMWGQHIAPPEPSRVRPRQTLRRYVPC